MTSGVPTRATMSATPAPIRTAITRAPHVGSRAAQQGGGDAFQADDAGGLDEHDVARADQA
jgi:hypothetical protein